MSIGRGDQCLECVKFRMPDRECVFPYMCDAKCSLRGDKTGTRWLEMWSKECN